MEPGYFRSREFALASVVGVLVLLGGALAVGTTGFGGNGWFGEFGCAAPDAAGSPLPLAARPGEGPRTRVLSYETDAAALDGGSLVLCADVGPVRVAASPDERVHVVFRLSAENADDDGPLDRTRVRAALREGPSGPTLSAWVERQETYRSGFNRQSIVEVELEVLLPSGAAPDVRADTSMGGVTLSGVRVRDADLASRFGPVTLEAVDLAGNLSASSGHGRVETRLASVQTGRVEVSSSFGGVVLEVPQRADVGYDVRASSGFGDVSVSVGPAETYESNDDETHVRTAGYAEKPTQVQVVAHSGHGDVRVAATQAS